MEYNLSHQNGVVEALIKSVRQSLLSPRKYTRSSKRILEMLDEALRTKKIYYQGTSGSEPHKMFKLMNIEYFITLAPTP